MTRVIESLLLIEFQIFVKFDPGQKSGPGGKLHKIPSRATTYHVPLKRKKKKKKRRARRRFPKAQKIRPARRRPPPPASFLSIFALQPRGSELIAFVFPRYEAGSRGDARPGGTRSKGKNLETRRFFEPSTRTFSRGASFKRNWCGFLARRGI